MLPSAIVAPAVQRGSCRRDAELKVARQSVWIGRALIVAGAAGFGAALLLARGDLVLAGGGCVTVALLGLILVAAGTLKSRS